MPTDATAKWFPLNWKWDISFLRPADGPKGPPFYGESINYTKYPVAAYGLCCAELKDYCLYGINDICAVCIALWIALKDA